MRKSKRMKHTHKSSARNRRKPLNVSVLESLVEEAKAFDLNLSRVAEEAIAAAVRAEQERRYLAQSAKAVEAHNRWVAERGVLLTPYWMKPEGS
jgi:antitoxin CcdA